VQLVAGLHHLKFKGFYLLSQPIDLPVPLHYQLPFTKQFTAFFVYLISYFGKYLGIKFIRQPLTDLTEDLTVLRNFVVSAVC
jgi:hypothetical protein